MQKNDASIFKIQELYELQRPCDDSSIKRNSIYLIFEIYLKYVIVYILEN